MRVAGAGSSNAISMAAPSAWRPASLLGADERAVRRLGDLVDERRYSRGFALIYTIVSEAASDDQR